MCVHLFNCVCQSDVCVQCGGTSSKDASVDGLLVLQHFSFEHLHAGLHCLPLRVQPHHPFWGLHSVSPSLHLQPLV